MHPDPAPDRIMQIGFGFMASKTLLSAVELGLFTLLADGPLDAEAIRERLGLHPRSTHDFLDGLVSLGLLERDAGRYANTGETASFLDRGKSSYVGGLLEMANARLYPFWGALTEGLRTGQPQNEAKRGENPFDAIYADPARLEGFLKAMSGISFGPAQAIAGKFPWQRYRTFVDIGAAQGMLAVQVAAAHPHLTGGGFDLPAVRPVFERFVQDHELSDRLQFHEGSFFDDPMPSADVLVMGHILHDWNLEQKRMLIAKAYDAINPGGALIVYDTVIDDERRENTFGLMISLTMLIETPGGFDYTGAQCREWMTDAGFRDVKVEHLSGPESAVIGIKPA